MPDFSDGKIEISICTGYGPMKMMMTLPGTEKGQPGSDHHDKPEMPCGFSGLSMPSLAGADPILLAVAILFIMLLAGRKPVQPPVAAIFRLRPPLRGPPFRF